MKRITCLGLAAAMTFGVAVASAQSYQPGPPPQGPGYGPPGATGYGPAGYRRGPWGATPAQWRRWHRGDRFQGPRYVIPNWRVYSLPRPLGGYTWVRAGGEFVMVNNSGYVGGTYISPRYP